MSGLFSGVRFLIPKFQTQKHQSNQRVLSLKLQTGQNHRRPNGVEPGTGFQGEVAPEQPKPK